MSQRFAGSALRRLTAVIVVMNAAGAPLTAQPPSRTHRFGISAGLVHEQVREDLLAPLRWTGGGALLGIEWQHETSASVHSAAAAVTAAILSNRFDEPGYSIGQRARYGYLRRIAGAEDGASLGVAAQLQQHEGYYESWDEEHVYWVTSYSIAPRLALDRRRGDRRLHVELEVPLLSAVSRPPRWRRVKIDPLTDVSWHLIDLKRGAEFHGWGSARAIRATAGSDGQWRGSPISLSYELEYGAVDVPAPTRSVIGRMTVTRWWSW